MRAIESEFNARSRPINVSLHERATHRSASRMKRESYTRSIKRWRNRRRRAR